MRSRLNIKNRIGKEVPVTTAPIRRGAIRKIMKNFRTIVNLLNILNEDHSAFQGSKPEQRAPDNNSRG
jgi:hypothetical protein